MTKSKMGPVDLAEDKMPGQSKMSTYPVADWFSRSYEDPQAKGFEKESRSYGVKG